MRIGFDVAQTCGEKAGCAWMAESLARALANIDTANTLILYHHFDKWLNASTAHGLHLKLPNVKMPMMHMQAEQARKIWKDAEVSGVALPGKPDIIQANSFNCPKVSGIPLVYLVHDLAFWVRPEFSTEANRLLCQRGVLDAIMYADAFIFTTEFILGEFERMFPHWLEIQQKPYTVIPLASRFEFGKRNSIKDAPQNFWLAVGSLEPRKNYELLLDAHSQYWKKSRLKKPLRIAGGKGWKSDGVHKRIIEWQALGRCEYLEYVADSKLQELYQSAFGLVFPSHYEGFGLPLVEAMSLGCPVIAAKEASLPEVGQNGVLYLDALTPESLCNCMLAVEEDSSLRGELIEEGVNRAQRLTWQRSADLTIRFYERILGMKY